MTYYNVTCMSLLSTYICIRIEYVDKTIGVFDTYTYVLFLCAYM